MMIGCLLLYVGQLSFLKQRMSMVEFFIQKIGQSLAQSNAIVIFDWEIKTNKIMSYTIIFRENVEQQG